MTKINELISPTGHKDSYTPREVGKNKTSNEKQPIIHHGVHHAGWPVARKTCAKPNGNLEMQTKPDVDEEMFWTEVDPDALGKQVLRTSERMVEGRSRE